MMKLRRDTGFERLVNNWLKTQFKGNLSPCSYPETKGTGTLLAATVPRHQLTHGHMPGAGR